ncbi:MAG: hypothetical protein JW720_13550 [Sedimentisphaerales bacterium]|nr:hypothetical protein [Sedimentisphaerales bacterium]
MIHENEVIMFVLGLGVLIFILANYAYLKRIPSAGILIAGFCVLVVGWAMTVLEGFLWENSLNFIEHTCYAVSSVLVAVWFWSTFGRTKENS